MVLCKYSAQVPAATTGAAFLEVRAKATIRAAVVASEVSNVDADRLWL
jgi:hypothetical protein